MLSKLHKAAYQEFITLLNDWQKICENHDKVLEITDNHPKLQQYFQQRVITLTEDELDITVLSFWRSLQTEIQREFRLLSTDILFWSSSRQPDTKEKRLKIICDRTNKLIAYCQKMLEI